VSTNQTFTVSLTVTNTGEADVTSLAPDLATGPGAALLTLTGGPAPASVAVLPGGGVQRFDWTYLANTAGFVVFTGTVTGATCAATPVAVVASTSATVQDAAVLDAALVQMTSPVCVGDSYLVTLTVTNTAGAPADLVTAAAFVHTGSG